MADNVTVASPSTTDVAFTADASTWTPEMTSEHYESQYEDFIYTGFEFERQIYLFVWEILVIITFLANLVVIIVLMHKNMRNATNMILIAIAVSDSMTGLVTLPSYIAVYQKFESAIEYSEEDDYYFNSSPNATIPNSTEYYEMFEGNQNDNNGTPSASSVLDKDLCRYFMISKYFVSKAFHTISIWLTVFLCVQRSISVVLPFKSPVWFSIRNTVIVCVIIAVCSPLLHVYHLIDEKTEDIWCRWTLDENGLVYIWVTFFLMHFIPCVTLVVFTVIFIVSLRKGSSNLEKSAGGKHEAFKKRTNENRRISIVVTAIVLVFLIPEIPYGVFLFYSAILTQTHQDILPLKTNRAIHAAYELSIVLSFHANVYIFTLFNRRFRSNLKRTLLFPVDRILGNERRRLSVSRVSSFSHSHRSNTGSMSKTMATEMTVINSPLPKKNSRANSEAAELVTSLMAKHN